MIAFHHPEKSLNSVVNQCFQKAIKGNISDEVLRFVDMVSMYPDVHGHIHPELLN